MFQKKENKDNCLPVTHDSIRLVDQVKTIAEQRIYLDEANELYTLLTGRWIQARITHLLNAEEDIKFSRLCLRFMMKLLLTFKIHLKKSNT